MNHVIDNIPAAESLYYKPVERFHAAKYTIFKSLYSLKWEDLANVFKIPLYARPLSP